MTEALSTESAAKFLGVSASLLEKLRVYEPEKSPPFFRVGRSVRYRLADLETWAGSNVKTIETKDPNDYKMWRVSKKEGGDETIVADHILFVDMTVCFMKGGRVRAIRQIEKIDSIRQWVP